MKDSRIVTILGAMDIIRHEVEPVNKRLHAYNVKSL